MNDSVVKAVAADSELHTHWTSHVVLADGTQLCIRPLRADDRSRESDFFPSLSEQTRYLRLFAPLKFLPPHLLNRQLDVDYCQRMALLGTVQQDGAERIVGIARYGVTDRADTVEFGIAVADNWQRHGIGRLLVRHLMQFARWRGYRRMTGMVQLENERMLSLAKSLGFAASHADSGAATVEHDLSQPPFPSNFICPDNKSVRAQHRTGGNA
jgi:acetyltransferase